MFTGNKKDWFESKHSKESVATQYCAFLSKYIVRNIIAVNIFVLLRIWSLFLL